MTSTSTSRAGLIARRALRSVLTLWLVVTVVFVVLRLSGDPVALLLPDASPPEQRAALRRELGLDRSIPVQYGTYLANLARGDLGVSIRQRRPALDLVSARLPRTLQLAGAAFILAAPIGLGLGVLAALKTGSAWDRSTLVLTTVLQAGPPYFVGILLILCFSLRLGWLPSSGYGSPSHLVLPAIALGAFTVAGLARLTRSAVLDVLRDDYVRTARAKGLTETAIVTRHALRNAALPIVTVLGLEIGGLVTGAVIIETVFAWPGMGRLTVDAVATRDYPVVQAFVLVVSAGFVLINLLVDSSYTLLDPRIRGI